MAETIPGLMGFVVRTLKAKPETSSRELYETSQARYPAVGELTVRQFHARYPLQAKKQLNRPMKRRFPVPRPEPEAGGEAAPEGAESQTAPQGAALRQATAVEEPSTPPREAIRILLFRLALDLETAHSRSELVDLVARLDRYVDEAMEIGAAVRS